MLEQLFVRIKAHLNASKGCGLCHRKDPTPFDGARLQILVSSSISPKGARKLIAIPEKKPSSVTYPFGDPRASEGPGEAGLASLKGETLFGIQTLI